MKKKIFFVLSSLRAGGAERVFWLISQHFTKKDYEVHLVLLNSKNSFFSQEIEDVKIIDLQTSRASLSFAALYKIIVREQPYAIFSAGGQVDMVLAILSYFITVPFLIARSTSIPGERAKFSNYKSKVFARLGDLFFLYNRFDKIICQTEEMKDAWRENRRINSRKLVVIPNPVIINNHSYKKVQTGDQVKLIIVGSLSKVKGHLRLLEIIKMLPGNFSLTIAGSGGLENEIREAIINYSLTDRVSLVGEISNVCEMIATHDILVITSFVEGFPNVSLEALSVGIPVVSFKVSGISELIVEGFNGYAVEKDELKEFKNCLIKASVTGWNKKLIKEDVVNRYDIEPIVKMYEKLIGS